MCTLTKFNLCLPAGITKYFMKTILTEHLRTTASGFHLKLNFLDGYFPKILTKGLGTTLLL